MTPRQVWDRCYGDFLMPSRLPAYRALLEAALGAGYAIVSVEAAWAAIGTGTLDPAGRTLVLRHDIDTGPATAGAMWRIERDLGVSSSYYFRLSTLDPGLMAEIAAGGSEASYHYEELATVAKRHRPRTTAAALRLVPEAQDRFRRNLERLRGQTGLPFRTVASHGDFVNRKLGLMNWTILADPAFRAAVGVDLETYDEAFMGHVTSRHADTTYPRFWTTQPPPQTAIANGEPVVYLLVHPRAWRVDRFFNARDDAGRVLEGIAYAIPRPSELTRRLGDRSSG